MIDYKKYFDILCWSINPDYQSIPDTKGMDWYDFYQFACEQAIAGVAFEGVKRMSDARGKMEENRQQLNRIVPSYARLHAIILVPEEFEKTPKRSIKRFKYIDYEI